MSKNITLSLDEAVLRKAKHAAVEEDKSVSEWVADLIVEVVSGKERSGSAKENALKRLKTGFHLGGKPFARKELHER